MDLFITIMRIQGTDIITPPWQTLKAFHLLQAALVIIPTKLRRMIILVILGQRLQNTLIIRGKFHFKTFLVELFC